MSGDRKRNDVRRMGSFLSAMRQQRGAKDDGEAASISPEAPRQSPPSANREAGASAPGTAMPLSERLIDASIRHVAASDGSADTRDAPIKADNQNDDPGTRRDAQTPPARIASSDEAALRNTVQEIWNAASSQYSSGVGRAAAQFGPRILELTGTRPGEAVLDIACGPGALAGAADAFGISATGIDFAPAMIATARARFPRVEFRIGDAEALDVFAASFEAVVSTFGVTQFIDPERSLKEAHRALKPSGRLILAHWAGADENPLLAAAEAALGGQADGVARKIDFSSAAPAEAALRATGFETIATERAEAVLSLETANLLEAAQMLDPSIALRIAGMTEEQRNAVQASIAEALTSYGAGASIEIPVQAIFYVAARPGEEAREEAGEESSKETGELASPRASAAEDVPEVEPVVTPQPALPQARAPETPQEATSPSEPKAQPVERLWQSAARRSGLGERQSTIRDPLADQRTATEQTLSEELPATERSEPSDAPNQNKRGFSDAASWKARSRSRFLSRSQNRPNEQGISQSPPSRRPADQIPEAAQPTADEPAPARRKPAFGVVRRMLDRSGSSD